MSPKNLWHLLQSGPNTAARNMALDHALLEHAALLGAPVLRFYGWTEPAASFGYFQKIAELEKLTLLRPLVRRPTGGGLVPHHADWTYSMVFPPSHAVYALKAEGSYRLVHEWIQSAFQKLGAETELARCCRRAAPGQCFVGHEKFDLLWQSRKIAGAAQRRTRDGLLVQGSVQPPLLNIARSDWENAMCDAAVKKFNATWSDLEFRLSLQARADALAIERYSQDSHNRRR